MGTRRRIAYFYSVPRVGRQTLQKLPNKELRTHSMTHTCPICKRVNSFTWYNDTSDGVEQTFWFCESCECKLLELSEFECSVCHKNSGSLLEIDQATVMWWCVNCGVLFTSFPPAASIAGVERLELLD